MTTGRHKLESKGEFKSLRAKFFSSGIIVLATIFFILMIFLPFITFELDEQIKQLEAYQMQNIRKEAETLARMLVFEFARLEDLKDIVVILEEDYEEYEASILPIRNYLWEKVIFNSIIRDIELLDQTGNIHLKPFGSENQIPAEEEPDIAQYIEISNSAYVSGSNVEYVFMPLYIDGNRWGVVKISVSTVEILEQIDIQIAKQDSFRQLIILLFIGAIVLSSLVGVGILNLLVHKITDPIKSLARNAELFSEKGEVSKLEFIETENDEVGLLAQNFNKMANDINRLLLEKDEAFTQLKASQEQLRQSEKLATLGQLSGGIAHEINNALSPIRLRSEEVLYTIEEGGKAETEDLQVILKGIEQCTTIVQKLRDFAAPSLGNKLLVDLNEIIKETVALVRRQIEKKNVRIRLNLQPIPLISASSSELEQVFMNMLLNARDAIEIKENQQGGEIELTTSAESGAVTVVIRDNGVGMDENTVGRMFEPFFTTKDIGSGTGLGMSVSFGIIQSHGAEIKVKSKPDQGTEITVIFPLPPRDGQGMSR